MKSITIAYDEADESLLLAFFQRLKIIIKNETVDWGNEGVPKRVADDIIEGLKIIEQHGQGNISLPSWSDMMAELRAEEAAIT